MKYKIIIITAVSVFAVLFPIAASIFQKDSDSNAIILNIHQSPEVSPHIQNESENICTLFEPCDADIIVDVLTDNGIESINMDKYLICVVAAEMPAGFEIEALKAQAVAARTYTMYKKYINPSAAHPDADVCTNSACCKAYKSLSELEEKWGSDFSKYITKITSAVSGTDGVLAMYKNEPILAAFHSSSVSMTEDCKNVWGSELDYLKSVKSAETAEDVNNYSVAVDMTLAEFKNAIAAHINADHENFYLDTESVIVEYTPSGRINTISFGDLCISGTEMRSIFNLRSTAIDLDFDGDYVTITTTGYGHGVGMSQFGANVMAQNGSSFEEILYNYYTGITLGSAKVFIENYQ